jgi:hypothetical protein
MKRLGDARQDIGYMVVRVFADVNPLHCGGFEAVTLFYKICIHAVFATFLENFPRGHKVRPDRTCCEANWIIRGYFTPLRKFPYIFKPACKLRHPQDAAAWP